MTELFEPAGELDARLVLGRTDRLGDLNRAGLLEAADVHTATRVAALAGETDPDVVLATALAVRAVRLGSVGADLERIREVAPSLDWPEAGPWLTATAGSVIAEAGAIRADLGLVYLDRYHRLERQVADDLLARTTQAPPAVDEQRLAASLAAVGGERFSDEQADAVRRAAGMWTTVLTGGPGTGKTSTVARLLAVLADQADRPLSIALTAPTGKAASRLQESVAAEMPAGHVASVGHPEAMTLHRLLGWRSDNATRFRHDRRNRLKHDVIVVDECSMVDLTMMARLLESVRPQTRLVLVGDPRQLTSVAAGAVLSDLVAGYHDRPDSPVCELTHNFRSREDIRAVAEALQAGDEDAVLASLRASSAQVEFVETDDAEPVLRGDLLESAWQVRLAAEEGRDADAIAGLDRHRLLCAHRDGPHGVRRWNALVEQWLGERSGQPIWSSLYVGRPLLVTANDYALGVYNGETGVLVRDGERLRARIAGSGRILDFAPGRLDGVETMHAMTIHKAQGGQARAVTVLLPEEGSRLLTRELFYTAVTRAQEHVRVVGSEASVRAAVRTRAQRATGLAQRIAGA